MILKVEVVRIVNGLKIQQNADIRITNNTIIVMGSLECLCLFQRIFVVINLKGVKMKWYYTIGRAVYIGNRLSSKEIKKEIKNGYPNAVLVFSNAYEACLFVDRKNEINYKRS